MASAAFFETLFVRSAPFRAFLGEIGAEPIIAFTDGTVGGRLAAQQPEVNCGCLVVDFVHVQDGSDVESETFRLENGLQLIVEEQHISDIEHVMLRSEDEERIMAELPYELLVLLGNGW